MTGDAWDGYVARFDALADGGSDLDGEARLLDALAPRGARVLDGGAGTAGSPPPSPGWATSPSASTATRPRRARAAPLPGVPYLAADLLDLDAAVLADEGFGEPFDVVALPGNVLVYVAPGTERDVLAVAHGLLAPGGRFVAGFATDRPYDVAALDADLAAVGSSSSTASPPGSSTRGTTTPTGRSRSRGDPLTARRPRPVAGGVYGVDQRAVRGPQAPGTPSQPAMASRSAAASPGVISTTRRHHPRAACAGRCPGPPW